MPIRPRVLPTIRPASLRCGCNAVNPAGRRPFSARCERELPRGSRLAPRRPVSHWRRPGLPAVHRPRWGPGALPLRFRSGRPHDSRPHHGWAPLSIPARSDPPPARVPARSAQMAGWKCEPRRNWGGPERSDHLPDRTANVEEADRKRQSAVEMTVSGPVATLDASPGVARGAHRDSARMSHGCQEAHRGHVGVCRNVRRGERQWAAARTGSAVPSLAESLQKRNLEREFSALKDDRIR